MTITTVFLAAALRKPILLEGPPGGANDAADLLRVEMEAAATLKVPLIAEVHQGKTWAEAKG